MQWKEQPVWSTVVEAKPDVFLFIGDAIYGDWDGKKVVPASEKSLLRDWMKLAAIPEFKLLRKNVPVMATWDNHDYGSHAGGVEFPVKEDSKEAFLTFFGEPKDSPRWQRSGIYDAKIIGPEGQRVQIILLDTKYNRSPYKKDPTPKEERLQAGKVGNYLPDEDPTKTHLGAEQWTWLEKELAKPADLRLVCSSTQIIPNQKMMDEWGNFPLERQRLLDLLGKSKGVVLLSGNAHYAEVSQVTKGRPSPLTEFTSSGMTHTNELYAQAPNSHRITGPSVAFNFGLVEINWESRLATLSACDITGKTLFSYKVPLDSLNQE